MRQWTKFSADSVSSEQRWLAATAISALLILFAALVLPPAGMSVAIGLLVSLLLGRTWNPSRLELPDKLPFELETSLLLAADDVIFERYRRIAELLLKISRQQDPIYRGIALEQIDDLFRRVTTIASGTLVFEGTETWRIIYEQLLRSPGLYLYRSVAWVKNGHYWQDEPSRKSMAVNFELCENEQLAIERVVIIADDLWPSSSNEPNAPVRGWLQQQARHGLAVRVVRQSLLRLEPDLLTDLGIYGNRALGFQEIDEQGQTLRFTLTFDFAKVAEAEARWNRLAVYAKPYSVHMDRIDLPG